MQSDDRFCAFDVNGRQILLLFLRRSDPEGAVLPFGTIPPHGGSGSAHVGFRHSQGESVGLEGTAPPGKGAAADA